MNANRARPAAALALVLSSATVLAVDPDERWDSSMGGCNGIIYELLEGPDGLIYLGGSFTECGGVNTRGVAVFDPAEDQWSSLGGEDTEGVNGAVYALAYHDGGLYVGGLFAETWGADAIQVSRIARWDLANQTWSALDDGVSSTVRALVVHDGALHAGGDFFWAGPDNEVEVHRVARWDGEQWSALISPDDGRGVQSTVWAMASYQGSLYVGGEFAGANYGGTNSSFLANYLVRWDGTQWSPVGVSDGAGVQSTVLELAVIDGRLALGGEFVSVNRLAGGSGPEHNIPARHVAFWDGSEWSAMTTATGEGTYHHVDSLVDDGDRIYVGGRFTAVNFDDSIAAARVAWWDGETFGALGSGTDNPVRTLLITGDGDLYAGGHFSEAGGQSAVQFARYATRGALDIEFVGTGTGSVSVDPVGLVCTEDCSADLSWDQELVITATAGAFSSFAGFSGSVCSGTAPCSFNFEEASTIIAQFDLVTHAVDVISVVGDGSVSLMNQEIEHGASVSWTVSPDAGWAVHEFVGDSCVPEDNGDGTWSAHDITGPCSVQVEFRRDVVMNVQLSMNPGIIGVPVTYQVAVSGFVSVPEDGQVTVVASTGENCIDSTTPPPTDGMTALYSCDILYSGTGARPLQINFSGSGTHVATENSSIIQHIVSDEFIFHDRFEEQ